MTRYATDTPQTVSIDLPNPSPEEQHRMPIESQPKVNVAAINEPRRPELNDRQHQAIVRATSELVQAAVTQQPMQWSDASLADAAEIPVWGCFAPSAQRLAPRLLRFFGAPRDIASGVAKFGSHFRHRRRTHAQRRRR